MNPENDKIVSFKKDVIHCLQLHILFLSATSLDRQVLPPPEKGMFIYSLILCSIPKTSAQSILIQDYSN